MNELTKTTQICDEIMLLSRIDDHVLEEFELNQSLVENDNLFWKGSCQIIVVLCI